MRQRASSAFPYCTLQHEGAEAYDEPILHLTRTNAYDWVLTINEKETAFCTVGIDNSDAPQYNHRQQCCIVWSSTHEARDPQVCRGADKRTDGYIQPPPAQKHAPGSMISHLEHIVT